MQTPVVITTTTCKMENCVLQASSFTQITIPRNNLAQSWRLFGQFDKFLSSKIYPGCKRHQLSSIRAQSSSSSGVTRFSSSAVETTSGSVDSKGEDVVFVAGATGKVGSRTVRELLKLGFQVRAGVRSAQRAESLVQSVKSMKLDSEDPKGLTPIEKLEIVECDLEKPDEIVPALGSASVVLCCIGASEKEILDITGPYRIDYQATKNLIDAARVSKVKHFILVTSLGTNKVGFPAAILNLFWGVLVWKRKAEEELIASGLPYTIVRPGGMERPTDSFKETHNITLSEEDTLFGGLVSNLQVAELLAVMAQNRDLSYCKIVEVVAETTAPLVPMESLLAKIPSQRKDMSKAEVKTIAKPVDPEPAKPVDPEPAKLVDPEPAKPVDPEPAKSSVNEVAADVAEVEIVQDRNVVVKARPLSPYTAYEDLKPPSSPTPSAPTGQRKEIATVDTNSGSSDSPSVPVTEVSTDSNGASVPATAVSTDADSPNVPVTEVSTDADGPSVPGTEVSADTSESVTVKLQKPRPLSPYTAYEDLKPPSSPTPSAPGISLDKSAETPKVVDGVPNVSVGTLANDPRESTFYHSPFPVYDDLRPPTSPTPSAPNSMAKNVAVDETEPETTSISTDDGVEPAIEENLLDEQNPPEPKPRPLSPYTMYEDMKPPSSPMPSPKKL